MRKALAAALVLGLGAGTASAAPPSTTPFKLRGSDSLFELTEAVIEACGIPEGPTDSIDYLGGGSSLGESEMVAGNQQIAPMSRFLATGVCTANVNADGCNVGLDGLAVWTDGIEANTCNTLKYTGFMQVQDLNNITGIGNGVAAGGVDGPCPGCEDDPDPADPDTTADEYEFEDWKDVLRVVYFGQHTHRPHDECAEAPVSRSPNTEKFCNSDVRRTLVETWGNLFQEGAGCTAGDADNCTTLKHAFRRDDVSGTTDTFTELLGVQAASATPFCNGTEGQDNDPIRRVCAGTTGQADGEQVCRGNVGTADLGLVLPIVVPPADQYVDDVFCATAGGAGEYPLAPTPGLGLCPNGNARDLGQCNAPARLVSGVLRFGCLARINTRPAVSANPNVDGRVYNLVARRADGSVVTYQRVIGGVETPREMTHAYYRIHQTRVMVGGKGGYDPVTNAATTGCKYPDETRQIGCLVGASPCSIGYSGLAGAQVNPTTMVQETKALALRSPLAGAGAVAVAPNTTTVRRILNPFGTGCGAAGDYDIRYPLARRLWINSLVGRANVLDTVDSNDADTTPDLNTKEKQIVDCYCNRTLVDPLVKSAGYITIDDNCPGAGCPAPLVRECP